MLNRRVHFPVIHGWLAPEVNPGLAGLSEHEIFCVWKKLLSSIFQNHFHNHNSPRPIFSLDSNSLLLHDRIHGLSLSPSLSPPLPFPTLHSKASRRCLIPSAVHHGYSVYVSLLQMPAASLLLQLLSLFFTMRPQYQRHPLFSSSGRSPSPQSSTGIETSPPSSICPSTMPFLPILSTKLRSLRTRLLNFRI